jgi:hypothetical protein
LNVSTKSSFVGNLIPNSLLAAFGGGTYGKWLELDEVLRVGSLS